MNARTQIFELRVEGRQADEAVLSLFHTVLFHRSLGKFLYNDEGSYSVGTVGYADVDCDFVDLTYVCCSSPALDASLRREVGGFSERLRGEEAGAGQISLEFFQRRPGRWLFGGAERVPWEVWTVRLELVALGGEAERQARRERVGELLADKILGVADAVNRHHYLPKMPVQTDLDLVFDTSFADVQPYLFKVNYSVSGPGGGAATVGSTVKKLIKETLAL